MNDRFQKLTGIKVVNGLLFIAFLTRQWCLLWAVCAAGVIVSLLVIKRTKDTTPYLIPLIFYSLAALWGCGLWLFRILKT